MAMATALLGLVAAGPLEDAVYSLPGVDLNSAGF